jgi:hypothetical protein
MAKPGKVYISVATADMAHGDAIAALLRGWKVPFARTQKAAQSDSTVTPVERSELAGADILLRVCTGAAQQSPRWRAETEAFTATPPGRKVIDIVLDAAYVPDAAQPATEAIQAAALSPTTWQMALRRAVRELEPTRQMKTRTLSIIAGIIFFGFLLLALYSAWQLGHQRTLWDAPAPFGWLGLLL